MGIIKTSSLVVLTIGLVVSAHLQVVAAAPSVRPAGTEVSGQLTINPLNTTNRSPILSGTMPAGCTDLVVAIFQDSPQYQTLLISTLVNGFVIDGVGNWSVDLATNGSTLTNGVYDINLHSDCGYSNDFTKDYYHDSYSTVLYVHPTSCDASCVPVYRFYDLQKGVHFYTANQIERKQLLKNSTHYSSTGIYRSEGISSFARPTGSGSLIPVHRFYNFKQGVHFYTSNQAEATTVNDTAFHTYRYEGVAYYTSSTQVTNAVPVHRFYNFKSGVHFFTSNQAEATHVNNTAAHTFRYEGIASYNAENK